MLFPPPPPPPIVQVMTPGESEWTVEMAREATVKAVASQAGGGKIVGFVLKASARSTGWVACGQVDTGDETGRMERFVAFVPGTIALVASDDPELVEEYWAAVGYNTPT